MRFRSRFMRAIRGTRSWLRLDPELGRNQRHGRQASIRTKRRSPISLRSPWTRVLVVFRQQPVTGTMRSAQHSSIGRVNLRRRWRARQASGTSGSSRRKRMSFCSRAFEATTVRSGALVELHTSAMKATGPSPSGGNWRTRFRATCTQLSRRRSPSVSPPADRLTRIACCGREAEVEPVCDPFHRLS